MSSFFKKYHPLFLLTLFFVVYLFKAYYFQIHDFANYYFGGYFFREGQFTADIYFPYYFNSAIHNLGYNNMFSSYAPNTPFIALFFVPLTLLPIGLSKLVFNIISISLFLVAIFRLFKHFQIKNIYLILLPLVFFIPLKNNLLFGQIYFLLFFLLSEGFLAYKKGNYKIMSLLWSIAIFLKVFPIILFAFLIIKKKYKASIFLFTICSFILLLLISINGYEVWLFYFTKVLSRASNGEIAGAFVDNYKSMFMFLKRLLVYNNIENESVLFDSPLLFKSLLFYFKIIIFGILFFLTKHIKKGQSLLVFSIWVMASIILSPYGSTYSNILLIFLYFYICKNSLPKKTKVLQLLLIFFICNYSFIKIDLFPFNYLKLFASILMFILILYPQKDKINIKLVFGFGLVISLVYSFLINSTIKQNESYLAHKTPILTYDYSLKNNTLYYSFWNENGKNIKNLNLPIIKSGSDSVFIKNNQVFYKNTQLTFDNSNKLKPLIIDGKIIFLSDKNSGIGFYQFYTIKLKDE